MSLRRKLILSVAAGVLLTFLLGTVLSYVHAIDKIDTEMQAAIAVGARITANAVDDAEEVTNAAKRLDLLVKDFDGDRHLRAIVVGTDGRIRLSSTLAEPDEKMPEWFYRLFSGHTRRSSVLLPDQFSGFGRFELEANPRNEIGEVWEDLLNTLRIVSILTLFISGAVYWILGSALRPLEQLSAAFSQFGNTNEPALMPEGGPDEFRRVYQAFNSMVVRQKGTEATNRKLHQQLLTVQEEERADIARDLHDDIGPFLFNVDVETASILKLHEERNYAALPARIKSIRDAVTHMQRHVRGILSRLRPAALLDLGLRDALEHLVESWHSRHPAIAITLDFSLPPLDEQQEDTIFRIVQEAINNSVRHGYPSTIHIEARENAGHVNLDIVDDGQGLSEEETRGFGILGMRERVTLHEGSLQIENQPTGRGVRLSVRFPVRHAEA